MLVNRDKDVKVEKGGREAGPGTAFTLLPYQPLRFSSFLTSSECDSGESQSSLPSTLRSKVSLSAAVPVRSGCFPVSGHLPKAVPTVSGSVTHRLGFKLSSTQKPPCTLDTHRCLGTCPPLLKTGNITTTSVVCDYQGKFCSVRLMKRWVLVSTSKSASRGL